MRTGHCPVPRARCDDGTMKAEGRAMDTAQRELLRGGQVQSLGGRLRMVLETAVFVSFGLRNPQAVPRVPLRRCAGDSPGKKIAGGWKKSDFVGS